MSFKFFGPGDKQVGDTAPIPDVTVVTRARPYELGSTVPPGWTPVLRPGTEQRPCPVDDPPAVTTPTAPNLVFPNLGIPYGTTRVGTPEVVPGFVALMRSTEAMFFGTTGFNSITGWPRSIASVPVTVGILPPRGTGTSIVPRNIPHAIEIDTFDGTGAVTTTGGNRSPLEVFFRPTIMNGTFVVNTFHFFTVYEIAR